MDQAIYGKIKNITDKEIYTDSFQLPKGYKISAEKKIEIEQNKKSSIYNEIINFLIKEL